MTRLALLGYALGLLACGTTSADKACGDVAQVRCNKRFSCTGGVGITRLYGDMATCLAREKLSCTLGLAAPQTGNSPSAVESCAGALPGFSCSDFLAGNQPAACIASGPKAAGATCAFTGQCASSYCNGNKLTLCGTCGAAPATGSSCAANGCARGDECVANTELCQTPGASGAPCNSGNPCAADLSCVGATSTAMGACQATNATAGGVCGSGMPPCDFTMGLSCEGAAGSKSCTATSYAGDGAPCGLMSDGTFVGCTAGTCYTSSGTIAMGAQSGSCKAFAADAAACDASSGPTCLTPARCVVSGGGTAGMCTLPTGSGC